MAQESSMSFSTASREAHGQHAPAEPNPFDKEEALPGLGIAVLWVVLSYVFVTLMLMPVQPV
jgi:hypothetical protein